MICGTVSMPSRGGVRYLPHLLYLALLRERPSGTGAYSAASSGVTAAVDPWSDADALEELGDEITTLAAHIHAATHRLLVLIADFDRRRGWELAGQSSCAH